MVQSPLTEHAAGVERFSPRFLRRHERAFYEYLMNVRPPLIARLRKEGKLIKLLDHVNDVLFNVETMARSEASLRLGPPPRDEEGLERRRKVLDGVGNSAVLEEMERWAYKVLSNYEVV